MGSILQHSHHFHIVVSTINNNMKQDNNNFSSGHPIIAQLLAMIPYHIFWKRCQGHLIRQILREDEDQRALHLYVLYGAYPWKQFDKVCKNIVLIAPPLIPFGLLRLPAKSTLSDANRKRNFTFFTTLSAALYLYYKSRLTGNWLSIGGEVNPSRVEIFEFTTIALFKEILKGAGRKPDKGSRKGGAKAFTKMNLAEGVPDYGCIKSAATNENVF